MRRLSLLTAFFAIGFGMTAVAQQDALTSALDSPVKMDAETFALGESIVCSLVLPRSASLFGADYDGRTGSFIVNELFSPFRVFSFDENCVPISTWSTTGIASSTWVTGIGFPNATAGATYWCADPFGTATVSEYEIGTGVATGNTFSTPISGYAWGGIVVDDNRIGEVLCLNEIGLDSIACVDAAGGGAVLCFYPNEDSTGGEEAFGNGISDAVAPDECSGQTLVNPSGTSSEGQVTRAGQYDCTGADPACTDRWDFAITGSTFINGIAEFTATDGDRNLICVDNPTSTVFRLAQPIGIVDCQAIDADMKLIWVNGSQSGDILDPFNVEVEARGILAIGVQKTGAGNGTFAHHMNAGAPSETTVSPLVDLGNSCFPFVGGSPLVVENNLGMTSILGTSCYFENEVPNPSKAPTFLSSLLQAHIDTSNLGIGQQFTHQLIAVNGAASSMTGGSLSNGVIMTMR